MPLVYDYFPKIENELLNEKIEQLFLKTREIKPKEVSDFKKPNQVDIMEDIKIDSDGTFLSYLKGRGEPMRTWPERSMISISCYLKRMARLFLDSLQKQSRFGQILSLIWLKMNYKGYVSEMLAFFLNNQIMPVLLPKEQYYSQSIREIRRAMRRGVIDENIINGISLMLEDMAYRYMAQDDFTEINKDLLVYKINLWGKFKFLFGKGEYCPAVREIYRVMTLGALRVDWTFAHKGLGDPKWRMMRKYICLALEFYPPLLKKVIGILKEINIDEVKPTKEDIYWMNRYNYRFFGKSKEERLAENEARYGKELEIVIK